MNLPSKIQSAGIAVHHDFVPGDLGQLIHIHGVQNFSDYGFNEVHEAYCARIASDFILDQSKGRSRVWLAKQAEKVVGSIFIVERSGNAAQLRLLFVDLSVRGIGLGRWLVEESIRYCQAAKFRSVCLWTVEGLDRAMSVYESVGFVRVEEKGVQDWGQSNVEVRFDLDLSPTN